MAYEESSSSDSKTEGESSGHCRMCDCVMCLRVGLRAMSMEKFGGLRRRAPSPGRACLFAADLGTPRIIPSKEVSPKKERRIRGSLLLFPSCLTFCPTHIQDEVRSIFLPTLML